MNIIITCIINTLCEVWNSVALYILLIYNSQCSTKILILLCKTAKKKKHPSSSVSIKVFWQVTPSQLISNYRPSEGLWCLHFQVQAIVPSDRALPRFAVTSTKRAALQCNRSPNCLLVAAVGLSCTTSVKFFCLLHGVSLHTSCNYMYLFI
jgi:hypothetical protein